MRSWYCSFGLTWLVVWGTIFCSVHSAPAQIVPDNTLPNNSSVTTQNNIRTITGGTQAGSNLFHSFEQFSIKSGTEAFFNNGLDIQNIISRVTGKSISNIDGLIRANGTANLFLLNPNGIIFGQGAKLDIGGSFLATTANAIGFDNLGFFGASNLEASPSLLTVNPSALLFNQIAAASIQNNSIAPSGLDPSGRLTATGLRVKDGQSLFMVGGNVSMDGGGLFAFGGRVQLGGLKGAGTVGLNGDGSNLSLSFPDGVGRSDVTLTNNATVNVRADQGGSIAINAGNLELANSRLLAGIAQGLGSVNSKAGNIEINAQGTVNLRDDSSIFNDVRTGATGQGGDVRIATGSLFVTNGAQLHANTLGKGDAGNVTITAGDTVSFAGVSSNGNVTGAFSNVQAGAVGNGGKVSITAGSVFLSDGAQVNAFTAGRGNAGSVTITARDRVVFDGVSNDGFPSNASSNVSAGAVGNGGSININAGSLSLTNGGQLGVIVRRASNTLPGGQGIGGDVNINVRDAVTISGKGANNTNSGIFSSLGFGAVGRGGDININAGSLSVTDDAEIDANTYGNGNAGDLTIQTGRLSIRNGAAVSANTSGTGNAGTLRILATDLVEVVGTGELEGESFLNANVNRSGRGKGGNLTIDTGRLVIKSSQVSASTSGIGDAGNLTINASDSVELSGEIAGNQKGFPGGLFAQVNTTGEGKGGNLTIETGRLSVSDGSKVQVATFGQGDAGNLLIRASDVDVFKTPRYSYFSTGIFADVTTDPRTVNPPKGNGGNLTIESDRLRIRDGANVSASTSGIGNAGTLLVRATDSVEVIGTGENGIISTLAANVNRNGRGKGGDLTIETRRLVVTDKAEVSASTFGRGDAGNLTVRAWDLVELSKEGGLYAQVNSSATGNGGNLTIESDRLRIKDGATVSASTYGLGNAGSLLVRATDLVEVIGTGKNGDDSSLAANVYRNGRGKGGDLTIETRRLVVKSSQVSASTSGIGNAGNLTVRAWDSVELSGKIIGDNIVNPGGLFAQVNTTGSGRGGNLSIQTNRLSVSDGSRVQVATFGQGDAGNLLIRASDIDVFETVNANFFPAGIFAGVQVDTDETVIPPKGNGGDLTIETNRLSVRDGAAVSATTEGLGNAGTLRIRASESVKVVGTSPNGNFKSEISAAATPESTGSGGSLRIETGKLIVSDRATVTVRNQGTKQGGDLEINARSINLDNQGTLTATTRSGNGGNINLKVRDLLLLRRNSEISTSAGTAAAGGDGGNITINAPSGFIVAVEGENSDITANAFTGSGGKVEINSYGIFGIQQRSREYLVSELGSNDPSQLDPQKLPTNDITAISQTNPTLGGEVNINSPEVDPTQGLIELTTEPGEPQLASGCQTGVAQNQSSFTITGRGGLPANPREVLRSNAVQVDWVDLPQGGVGEAREARKVRRITPSPIVEAQGWVVDGNGDITLVAQAPTGTPHSSGFIPTSCH